MKWWQFSGNALDLAWKGEVEWDSIKSVRTPESRIKNLVKKKSKGWIFITGLSLFSFLLSQKQSRVKFQRKSLNELKQKEKEEKEAEEKE